MRRVEDITEALWGTRVSPSVVSDLHKKIYKRIDKWRNATIEGTFPYVYLDGIVMKRSCGGSVHTKQCSEIICSNCIFVGKTLVACKFSRARSSLRALLCHCAVISLCVRLTASPMNVANGPISPPTLADSRLFM